MTVKNDLEIALRDPVTLAEPGRALGTVSPRQPRITAAQLLRALKRDGWYEHHQTGSHLYLKHETKPGLVTVARHAGVTIKPKTLASILEQTNLSTDQLRELL